MDPCPHPLASPAFRLVRTLDLRFSTLEHLKVFRAEIFQDPDCPTHFRFWVWTLQMLKVGVFYPPDGGEFHWQPLHSSFYFPHTNADSFLEAANVDAAEAQLHVALQAQFQERYNADNQ